MDPGFPRGTVVLALEERQRGKSWGIAGDLKTGALCQSVLSTELRLQIPLTPVGSFLNSSIVTHGTNCFCCLVAQSCLTLCDSMDCSLPGSSVHAISQTGIPE